MFFKLAEISLIITSKVEKFLVLAVLQKTFSIGKKSNFKFQNRKKKLKFTPGSWHFFWNHVQKSHQVAGTFFETTSENPNR